MYSFVAPCSYWLWRPGLVHHAFFIRMALWLRDVRALLFIKWVWVDMDIRSKVRLVFSLLSLVLSLLPYGTLLKLYGLRRDVLFSLIRLTLWCMNVNNCAGACTVKCCLDFLRGFGIKLWWLGPSLVFEGLEMYSLRPEMASVSGPIRFYFFVI
jgi:hypothetical protein